MRNTLICTVGTSLFEGNLKNLSEQTPNRPDNWKEIKHHFDNKNWNELAKELLKIKPDSRICGAEINTVEEAKKKKWLELSNLFFLVSDTEAGRDTGTVLKKYFENREDLKLKQVDYYVVENLQDKKPVEFKVHGLRNLVREIGGIIQRIGNEYIAIDATGGYKAQIAIAVLVGQALNIPVYYKHERFSEIIDFPPLPISLDYDLLGRKSHILTDFERGKIYSLDELDEFDEKLRVFLTETDIEDKTVFELNPVGQLYLTSFRLRFPKAVRLTPLEDKEREKPSFRDDHFPIGFEEFVEKIWQENRWIKTCHSRPYDKQLSIKGVSFYVRNEENKSFLIGTYQDKNNFGARFRIFLADESTESLTWAADYLNRKYKTD
jgi:putative CRISPR-associated protein (TIGR02619 family)